MSKDTIKIRIVVEGGNIQSVQSSNPRKTVVQLIDWDNIKKGDEVPPENEFLYPVDKIIPYDEDLLNLRLLRIRSNESM